MSRFIEALHYLRNRFNLHEDAAEEEQIVESIRKDSQFKGANLWTLVFAIFIASIGLNVNSTAVIIGAMLISPLMGPIMGIGLAMSISDFALLKRGAKNLGIAIIVSVSVSALYFFLSPLHEANSELLARTHPSLWDVFIAFFGGLAGIVGATRKEKSNVIPGVAIATALMPPLCTAGFGIAIGNLQYIIGAFYLFFINSVFICTATFLIVKRMRFRQHQFKSEENEKRIVRYIAIITIVTLLPSIYLAYKVVEKTIFEGNARSFVNAEFRSRETQVVNRNFKMEKGRKSIELLLMGKELSPSEIDSLKVKMPRYHLDSSITLTIHQGVNARNQIDMAQVRASILEEVLDREPGVDTVYLKDSSATNTNWDFRNDLKLWFPEILEYRVVNTSVFKTDSSVKDSILEIELLSNKPLRNEDQARIKQWIAGKFKPRATSTVFRQVPPEPQRKK